MLRSGRKNYSSLGWRAGFCYRGDASKSQPAVAVDTEALKAAIKVIDKHTAELSARYRNAPLPAVNVVERGPVRMLELPDGYLNDYGHPGIREQRGIAAAAPDKR